MKNMQYCPNCNGEIEYVLNSIGEFPNTITWYACPVCGHKEDSVYDLHAYNNTCFCGKKHTLLTQDDNNPEYYSVVISICECGRLVRFSLPVN